jgi:hypothetical protein
MNIRSSGQKIAINTLTGSDNAKYVLSSSPHPDNPNNVRIADFSDGRDDWNNKDNNRFSGRPVRVVEVNHLTL